MIQTCSLPSPYKRSDGRSCVGLGSLRGFSSSGFFTSLGCSITERQNVTVSVPTRYRMSFFIYNGSELIFRNYWFDYMLFLRSNLSLNILHMIYVSLSCLQLILPTSFCCSLTSQAMFEVADRSGQATVVLWNTLCMDWYRYVHPGSTLRLARYRVKESYKSRTAEMPKDDIGTTISPSLPIVPMIIHMKCSYYGPGR